MNVLNAILQKIVYFMYGIAGIALAGIMFLTVADVFLRLFKLPIVGTYEIVSMLGAVVIGFAIPQTTIDRGHVLMDFLTGRLSFGGQRVLHLFTRLLACLIFLIIGWNLFQAGERSDGHRPGLFDLEIPGISGSLWGRLLLSLRVPGSIE